MEAGGRSTATGIALVVAASLFGLLLPLAFGNSDSPALALLWLGFALAACLCVLLPMRPIARAAAAHLRRGAVARAEASIWNDRTAPGIARLLVATGYVVLVQAILRHPLVAVFGADADPFLVEAAVGMLALLAVLGLLSWMYTLARPLLEGLARGALDAALVTAPSAEASATAAIEDTESATVLSPRARAINETEAATVMSPQAPKPEELATELAPDATPTVRVDRSAEGATELSG